MKLDFPRRHILVLVNMNTQNSASIEYLDSHTGQKK